MIVLLILAVAAGLFQIGLFIGGLILLATKGDGRVTVGVVPGIVSVIFFALYFLL